MPKQLYRIQGLKGVRELIKSACLSHPAVAEFKSGAVLEDSEDNKYPLAFLESGFRIDQVDEQSETYDINLNIVEWLPKEITEDEIADSESKTTQIMDEIHFQLTEFSPSVKVTPALKLVDVYESHNDARLVYTRAEFTITIARYTAALSTPMDGINITQIPNHSGGGTSTPQPKSRIIDPLAGEDRDLNYGETYTVVPPAKSKVVLDGIGVILEYGETKVITTPVVEPGHVVDTLNGVNRDLAPGETYTVVAPAKSTIIDNVSNTTKTLEYGETYTVNDLPDQYSLSLNYPVDSELTLSVAITSDEATTYTTNTLTNVATAVYKKNGTVVSLPITLAVGNTLTVDVTKTSATSASRVVLSN